MYFYQNLMPIFHWYNKRRSYSIIVNILCEWLILIHTGVAIIKLFSEWELTNGCWYVATETIENVYWLELEENITAS